MLKVASAFFRSSFVFLVAFYLLLFTHELGHFLTGSLFGLSYELFSVGSGPAVFHTVLGSGLEINFGLFPSGGVCVLTDASAMELMDRPAYQSVSLFMAGVTSSCLLTWLVLGLSVRLSDKGSVIQQTWRSFLLSVGTVLFSPLVLLLTCAALLRRKTFVRLFSRGVLWVYGAVRANQVSCGSFVSRSLVGFAALMLFGNLYLGVINASPLGSDLDGFKAAFFLMKAIGDVSWIYYVIMYWLVSLEVILVLGIWRGFSVFVEMLLWLERETSKRKTEPRLLDFWKMKAKN